MKLARGRNGQEPHTQLSRRERQDHGRHLQARPSDRLRRPTRPPGGTELLDRPRTTPVLEDKGYLRHEEQGLRYVFIPTIAREQARQSALKRVVDTFFDGSAEQVVAALLDGRAGTLSDQELNRLSELIDKARKEGL